MSHQVKLSQLSYKNIEDLKKAIADEGLTITDRMDGYYKNWNKGAAYSTTETMEFGIKIGSKSPCGVVSLKDGTYKLVGDEWGVSYGGHHGLKQLSSHLDQRYRIVEAKRAAQKLGFNITIPKKILDYNSKDEIEIVLTKKQVASVGMLG